MKARGVLKEREAEEKEAGSRQADERGRDIGLMLMMEGAHPGRHLYLGLL